MPLNTTSDLPINSPITGEIDVEILDLAHLRDLTPNLIVVHLRGSEVERIIFEKYGIHNALVIGEARSIVRSMLCRLTTDEYLVLIVSTEEERNPLVTFQDAVKGHDATLSDLTHGYGKLKLSGTGVPRLLSRLCGLDFSKTGFPRQRVAQTSLAKVHATLIRADEEPDIPTFYVLVDRSVCSYIWRLMKEIIQPSHRRSRVRIG